MLQLQTIVLGCYSQKSSDSHCYGHSPHDRRRIETRRRRLGILESDKRAFRGIKHITVVASDPHDESISPSKPGL